MEELLSALAELKDKGLIITMPNSDTDSRTFIKGINDFCARNPNAKAFTSLGQLKYLSCIKQVDGVLGNSSSGLTEVPTFKKGTINIGDRQLGRIQAKSVINCSPNKTSIKDALNLMYSQEFQKLLQEVENPYGNGGASKAIVEIIEQQPLIDLLKKQFYDWPNI